MVLKDKYSLSLSVSETTYQKNGKKVLKSISDNLLTGKRLNKSVEKLYKSIEKDIAPTLKSNYKYCCKRFILSKTSFVKPGIDLERYKRLKIKKYRFIAT